jgi:hypothetical protein
VKLINFHRQLSRALEYLSPNYEQARSIKISARQDVIIISLQKDTGLLEYAISTNSENWKEENEQIHAHRD